MRRNLTIDNPDGRPTCYDCLRPHTHCICRLTESFEAHFNLLILQHPHERKKYYGTAKLVRKTILNSRILRGLEFQPQELERALGTQTPYLLYPSKDAKDCNEIKLDKSATVIVLDGTWAEAGKIMHRNPLLKTLPHLTFSTQYRSNYRIRKQPKENYLSTIESIGHLLKSSAISNGKENLCGLYDKLFEGFDKMVDQQEAYFPRSNSLGGSISTSHDLTI